MILPPLPPPGRSESEQPHLPEGSVVWQPPPEPTPPQGTEPSSPLHNPGGRRAALRRGRRRQWLNAWLERSSPFTTSLAAHSAVLILLALVLTAHRVPERISLDMSFASDDQTDDGSQGVEIEPPDESAEPEAPPVTADEPPVEDPVTSPVLVAPLVETGAGATADPMPERVPLTTLLVGREEGRRDALVQAFGGSAETELAVARSLAWLAKQQRSDGLWSLKGPYRDGSDVQENELAATAMALLAFQGAGNTPTQGKYQRAVARGWRAVVDHQREDGAFTLPSLTQQTHYAHAMATYALCDLFGMTRNPDHARPASRAVDYALEAQGKDGGWRYAIGEQPGDMSVTGWFVLALKSAEVADLPVPPEAFAGVSRFLDSVARHGGSRYGYRVLRPNTPPASETPAVSAEGLLARQFLGWAPNDPRMVDGLDFLMTTRPFDFQNKKDVYAWYYTTQVAHNVGGDTWARWNERLREVLPAEQVAKGRELGSWDPALDQWGHIGGRLFMTCFCTWMLEAYYRHLPLFETVAPAAINQVHHIAPAE